MGRRLVRLSVFALMAICAACSGGGSGGSGGGGGNNQIPDPTGRVTIEIGDPDSRLAYQEETTFTVTVKNAGAGIAVEVTTGEGMEGQFDAGTEFNNDGFALTNAQGQVTGVIRGRFGGTWRLQARLPEERLPDGSNPSVFISIVVNAPAAATPTVTMGPGGPPTATPVAVPLVRTIYMETDVFTVSTTNGGTVTVRAFAFDQNNQPLNDVNLLFDFEPKVGLLRDIATRTRPITLGDRVFEGVATVQIKIEPNSAPPGNVTVTARAAEVEGSVTFTVVPGAAGKPVSTVLLRAGTTTCGTDAGGSVALNAVVFDADNNGLNGVNVLFLTEVGTVIPLTAVTAKIGAQDGVARTTLQIPAGALVRFDALGNILPYTLSGRAAGIEGTTQIYVVPGRECKPSDEANGELGEPSSIILGASPNRIRVRGSGARELSNITATVIDNNGNRLNDEQVRFSIADESVAAGALLLPANLSSGLCSATVGRTCASGEDCPDGESCNIDPRNRFKVLTDRAGNAPIQLRAGSGLGTVSVQAEVPSSLDSEFTEPCSNPDPGQPDQRCIIARRVLVTVTAGLPGQVSLAINNKAVNNNDGTFLTTLSGLITDTRGNIVEDGTPAFFEVLPFDEDDSASRRIGVQGFSSTNDDPPCDVSRFIIQTGEQVTPQPGDAITCIKFPLNQEGTDVRIRVESLGVDAIQTVTLPGRVADLLLTVGPDTVQVTEEQEGAALVTAEVLDIYGNGVRNAKIRFLSEAGSFGSSPFAYSDDDGIAAITLTIPPGTPEGDVRVQAFGAGITRLAGPFELITVKSTGTTPGPEGTPNVVVFNNAAPSTIGVRASGLIEQSVVSFSVRDRLDKPLAGVSVAFRLNGIGGERLTDGTAVTDETGIARTTVVAGTRSGPVQVTATVDINNDQTPDLVTQSTAVNVVGAPPTFSRISMAAAFLNVAGRVTFGLEDQITAFLNDRFGNPVPPGTAVNFMTNGASVFDQTVTDRAGRATTTLISEGGVPDGGIITVLAATHGEEPFIDANGNGVYDAGEVFTDIPEPFIDFNGNGQFDPPEAFEDTNSNGRYDNGESFTDRNGNGAYDDHRFERFIDVNGSGAWDVAQNPGQWDANGVVWSAADVTFSAHTFVVLEPTTFEIADGGFQSFTLYVGDVDGNPIVGGSTVSAKITGDGARLLGEGFRIPDAETFGSIVPGLNQFRLFVLDDKLGEPSAPSSIALEVTVSSEGLPAGGNGSVRVVAVGALLPPPTGTPAPTPTATPIPPPTDTPVPPSPTETRTPTMTSPPTATFTLTPTITPTPVPRSLSFVGAVPQMIGVHGSGLPEQSVLTYRLTDAQAKPVPGLSVQFSLTSLGGESVEPTEAVTDSSGLVQTVLTSGTRTTTVRVLARVAINPSISAQSTAVSIVGAPPSFNRFSTAAQFRNVSGRVTFGLKDVITAFVNDRFGNAVPAGTIVNFFTNGGSIVEPSPTDTQGQAKATLITEGGAVPADGIVQLMAVTRGEEPFVDVNGNGVYDAGEPFTDIPEPFIDVNGNGVFDASDPFEIFVDTNGNGTWDTTQEVGVWNNDALIFTTSRVTFSDDTLPLGLAPTSFTIPDGGSQEFVFFVRDQDNNPIVGGSQVTIEATGGVQVVGPSRFTIPDTQTFGTLAEGINMFHFSVADAAPQEGETDQLVVVTVSVTSDAGSLPAGGNGSRSSFGSGVLLKPPATPTSVPPTMTPTSVPPTSTPTQTP